MADLDTEKVTELMVERNTRWASRDTAAKELVKMTGLELDVARAFYTGLTGGGLTGPDIRGYKKSRFQKKKPR